MFWKQKIESRQRRARGSATGPASCTELRGEGGMGTRAGDLPRRAPTYLPVDVDAAGSKGGGAVAGHVVVNGWLRRGRLRVRGHCGDTGGDHQLLGNSAPINPAIE